MLLANGDCRFGHFTSLDFGLLVRQLAFTSSARTPFFWKGGTPHCNEQLSNHALLSLLWASGRMDVQEFGVHGDRVLPISSTGQG